jgi:DNA-directed RNA polymerase specialized sigma24 family protein
MVLGGRDGLLALLVSITVARTNNLLKHHHALRRDLRREAILDGAVPRIDGSTVLANCSHAVIAHMAGTSPTPAAAAAFNEEAAKRLASLQPVSRRIAQLRLAGYSEREIADRVGCSTRTVIRRLERIRAAWRLDGG